MKLAVSSHILGFVTAGSLVVAMVGCGGKAGVDGPVTELGGSAGLGGSTGSGGSTGLGGSTGVTTLGTTVPDTHRVEALSCIGVNSPLEPAEIRYPENSTCTRHADCTEGANGKCIAGYGGSWNNYHCIYDQCATDADCDQGMVCYCTASTAARCLSVGNCRTDADCGNSIYSFCSPSTGFDCSGSHVIEAYHCHTASDTCVRDADCTGSDYCNFSVYAGRWECTAINNNCVIG